jgi:hypothetical protein
MGVDPPIPQRIAPRSDGTCSLRPARSDPSQNRNRDADDHEHRQPRRARAAHRRRLRHPLRRHHLRPYRLPGDLRAAAPARRPRLQARSLRPAVPGYGFADVLGAPFADAPVAAAERSAPDRQPPSAARRPGARVRVLAARREGAKTCCASRTAMTQRRCRRSASGSPAGPTRRAPAGDGVPAGRVGQLRAVRLRGPKSSRGRCPTDAPTQPASQNQTAFLACHL